MVFARGERNRAADRARIAPLGGHVGRNLGDQPYIMDLVYHNHFANTGASAPEEFTSQASGAGGFVFIGAQAPTFLRVFTPTSSANTWRYIYLGGASAGSAMNGMTGYTRDASMRLRARWGTVDANSKILAGLAATAALASTADGLFFGVNGAASSSYFVCISRKDGVATTAILDGGGTRAAVPLDTAWHDVSIVCDSTAGEVRFYVDRQLAATITTDLPSAATDYLNLLFSVENGATASQEYMDADVVILSEAAP